MKALLVGLALLLAGCATSIIVMKNPKTGLVQQCVRPTFGEVHAADKCAAALERDGWIRLSDR